MKGAFGSWKWSIMIDREGNGQNWVNGPGNANSNPRRNGMSNNQPGIMKRKKTIKWNTSKNEAVKQGNKETLSYPLSSSNKCKCQCDYDQFVEPPQHLDLLNVSISIKERAIAISMGCPSGKKNRVIYNISQFDSQRQMSSQRKWAWDIEQMQTVYSRYLYSVIYKGVVR